MLEMPLLRLHPEQSQNVSQCGQALELVCIQAVALRLIFLELSSVVHS